MASSDQVAAPVPISGGTGTQQNLFLWKGNATQVDGKLQYQAFQLNGVDYAIGDCVYLFPEDEASSHYIGRLVSAFHDEQSPDPLCIEVSRSFMALDEELIPQAREYVLQYERVKWYERRTNFEPNTRGIEESEREVFELEDADINQIGCISGKVHVIRSRSYEEAYAHLQGVTYDWYFCRGYFLQASNSFQYYTDAELGMYGGIRPSSPPAAAGSEPQAEDDMLDEETPSPSPAHRGQGKRKRQPQTNRAGYACLECGATSTPQWREGPAGPRTLCNACGLRVVRAQQRGKKPGGGGGGGGRGGGRGGAKSAPSSGRKGQGSQRAQRQASASAAGEQLPHQEDAAAALLSWSGRANGTEDEDAHGRSMRPSGQAAKLSALHTAEFACNDAFLKDEQEEARQYGRGGKRRAGSAGMGMEVNEDMVRKCHEMMMGLAAGGIYANPGDGSAADGAFNLQALSSFPFQGDAPNTGAAALAGLQGLPGLHGFAGAGADLAAAAAAAASLGASASGGLDASTTGAFTSPVDLLPGGFGALLSNGAPAAGDGSGQAEEGQKEGKQGTMSDEAMAAAAAAAAAAAIQGWGQQGLLQQDQGHGEQAQVEEKQAVQEHTEGQLEQQAREQKQESQRQPHECTSQEQQGQEQVPQPQPEQQALQQHAQEQGIELEQEPPSTAAPQGKQPLERQGQGGEEMDQHGAKLQGPWEQDGLLGQEQWQVEGGERQAIQAAVPAS